MITKNEIVSILKRILEQFELSEDQYDEELISYGFDSLVFIRLVVVLEDEYNIEIPDEFLLIDEFDTVNKIYKIINGI